ncbi:MAG TPA: T9SS type A sorting domain-containing protein [Chitinophagales bacterium]|nr:T9SS type A sorting domain-containing protein [Chitinophagales bacterium]
MSLCCSKIITCAVFIIPQILLSQVQDKSYTDCNGNSESIYEIIGQGIPLLIASTGLDCSICMSEAPDVQQFAGQHPEVRIWSAMNFRYSTVQPTCSESDNWRNTYSWNNIFMFLDLHDEWQGLGYPTYYLISPLDSLIAYQGPKFNIVSLLALELIRTGIKGIKDSGLEISVIDKRIRVSCLSTACEGIKTISLFTLSGQQVLGDANNFGGQSSFLNLQHIPAGIYLLKLSAENGEYASRIFINK